MDAREDEEAWLVENLRGKGLDSVAEETKLKQFKNKMRRHVAELVGVHKACCSGELETTISYLLHNVAMLAVQGYSLLKAHSGARCVLPDILLHSTFEVTLCH